MRILLGAFGDPGHAFPMLGLGEALVGRGHDVAVQTWRRWEDAARGLGMTFFAAPEYHVFPTRERPLQPYAAAVRAARETRAVVQEYGPDVAVSDILTPAPALAAELEGVPVATLVPHLHPHLPSGFPPYAIGARLPRTRLGARLWRATDRIVAIGLERGRQEYNDCRARLGLGPLPWVHTGLSRSLTLVATLPQLEYPRAPGPREGRTAPTRARRYRDGAVSTGDRAGAVGTGDPAGGIGTGDPADAVGTRDPAGAVGTGDRPGVAEERSSRRTSPSQAGWPPWVRIVGPLMWEPPAEAVAPPPGDGPVVLVAPSTAQDAEHRLLRAALAGLADEPVRVIAIWNGRESSSPVHAPANALLVPWLSYSKTMPACDLVVCHGGHGTLVRALTTGCPVVVSPAGGDMAENGARADWAGLGVRLPRRFCTAGGVRAAVRRALGNPRLADRARSVAAWAATHDAGTRAAEELEAWAARA